MNKIESLIEEIARKIWSYFHNRQIMRKRHKLSVKAVKFI